MEKLEPTGRNATRRYRLSSSTDNFSTWSYWNTLGNVLYQALGFLEGLGEDVLIEDSTLLIGMHLGPENAELVRWLGFMAAGSVDAIFRDYSTVLDQDCVFKVDFRKARCP